MRRKNPQRILFHWKRQETIRLKIDWTKTKVKKPNKPGATVLKNYPLSTLKNYIDWTPFFMTWELKGKYPSIFDDENRWRRSKKTF